MKKLFITLAVLAAAAFSANAQFRVEAGLNWNKYQFKGNTTTQNSERKTGFQVSGLYSLSNPSDGGFEVGLSFIATNTDNAGSTLSVYTLEVPFRGLYEFNLGGVTLTPALGIYAGYRIGGKSKVGNLSTSPFDGDSGLKRFDFGTDDELLLGFGKFTIGLGYAYSFLNNCKNSNVKVNTNTLYVAVGMKF